MRKPGFPGVEERLARLSGLGTSSKLIQKKANAAKMAPTLTYQASIDLCGETQKRTAGVYLTNGERTTSVTRIRVELDRDPMTLTNLWLAQGMKQGFSGRKVRLNSD